VQLLDLHEEGHPSSHGFARGIRAAAWRGHTDDLPVQYQYGEAHLLQVFCKCCGIHSFYTPRLHPDRISVNARCLEGVDMAALQPSFFDGQSWEEAARARRAAEGG
jgi:hypothetical protein